MTAGSWAATSCLATNRKLCPACAAEHLDTQFLQGHAKPVSVPHSPARFLPLRPRSCVYLQPLLLASQPFTRGARVTVHTPECAQGRLGVWCICTHVCVCVHTHV